jgi:hypothetical protein
MGAVLRREGCSIAITRTGMITQKNNAEAMLIIDLSSYSANGLQNRYRKVYLKIGDSGVRLSG